MGRKITEYDIAGYVAKKALKGKMKVANKCNKFVWRKKIERDVNEGVPLEFFSVKAEKRKQREIMREIEKIKKTRKETAIKKVQHEEAMALIARERAGVEFQDWVKKEQEFCFHQSKIRSQIRVREARIKPIDILSMHLDPSDIGNVDMQMHKPYEVFNGLTLKDMEELCEEIKLHLEFDRATPTHVKYWEALVVVCDWELAEARRKDALDQAIVLRQQPPAELIARESGLHSSIKGDIENFLQEKTVNELEALHSKIESRMRSGTAKVVEYWEAILKRVPLYKAKAILEGIYSEIIHKRLEHIEQPFYDETKEVRSYSPELFHDKETEQGFDPEGDKAVLERRRAAVLEEQKRRVQEAFSSRLVDLSDDSFETKAMKAMGAMMEGEAVFGSNDEVNLNLQVLWWHNHYCPRKPKHFNRVRTGYEWNKYNQTHYDHNNPPPKMVHGYKFNIFYPNLVEKTKSPIYTIEKDGNSTETCIIRFHAGPPYEDIAFRIVNKEWEHKKGFKCTFEREVLHVYFNLKRDHYRR